MSEYTTGKAETYGSISIANYGFDALADLIRKANPAIQLVGNVVPAGTKVFIPDFSTSVAPLMKDVTPDEVTLRIGGKEVKRWAQVRLSNSIDRISDFSFLVPFDASDPEQRKIFKPFSYARVEVFIGKELQFNGTLIEVNPSITPDSVTVVGKAYALPGVLQDCTASSEAYPIEFDGVKLEEVATVLAEPFSVAVRAEADTGAKYDFDAPVSLSADQKILEFLVGLAKQKNLVISNDAFGVLVFQRPITDGTPVARLEVGVAPLDKVRPHFNQRGYYSSVTGIFPTELSFLGGDKYTEKNVRLGNVFRPLSFTVNDSEDAELKTAVVARVSRMFAGMCYYEITVIGWRDENNTLWAPNTILRLKAPSAMVYTDYKFVVTQVEFHKKSGSKYAILRLSLPGAYSGEIPARLPWD